MVVCVEVYKDKLNCDLIKKEKIDYGIITVPEIYIFFGLIVV